MGQKIHCDSCDATPAQHFHTAVVDPCPTGIKVDIKFLKQYQDGDGPVSQDLCPACQRRALTAVLDKMGGPTR